MKVCMSKEEEGLEVKHCWRFDIALFLFKILYGLIFYFSGTVIRRFQWRSLIWWTMVKSIITMGDICSVGGSLGRKSRALVFKYHILSTWSWKQYRFLEAFLDMIQTIIWAFPILVYAFRGWQSTNQWHGTMMWRVLELESRAFDAVECER